ncbi:MAG: hypothetical protein U0R26_05035 [Solirubrobacterales bacterium]
MAADKRGHVAEQDADPDSGQESDDQRRVDVDEKDFDPDLLRVLEGDDDDEGDENSDEPGTPVDRLPLLGHAAILEAPGEPAPHHHGGRHKHHHHGGNHHGKGAEHGPNHTY